MLTELIDLVTPARIPGDVSLASWWSADVGIRTVPPTGPAHTNQMLLPGMREMHDRLRARVPESRPHPNALSENEAAHDDYFHVRRVSGDASAIFLRAVVRARVVLFEEDTAGPSGASLEHAPIVDRALADLYAALTGLPPDAVASAETWTLARDRAHHGHRRWIRGHQIFAVLTQGLIYALRALARAVRAGDTRLACAWADTSISLLRGSGAAFVFAGDFSPETYSEAIRPSMAPPAARIALSGVMSADHRALADTLRDMRPALKSLGEADADRLARLRDALGTVYDRHIHVCERFVGERPSLLTEGRLETSGPDQLRKFKALRLKPLAHRPRTHRLDDPPEARSRGDRDSPPEPPGSPADGERAPREDFKSNKTPT